MRKSIVLAAALMTVVATGSTSFAKGPGGGGGGGGGKPAKTIQFESSTYSANETGVATIRIIRNFTGAASVLFTSSSTEADGSDFSAATDQSWAFARKSTTLDVNVPLWDDGVLDEAPEAISLSIALPAGLKGVSLGAQSTATLTVTDDDTTLAAPTLSATRGSDVGDVDLSWTTISQAASYTLYKWDGSDFVEFDTASGTTYTDDGLTPGTRYSYVVVANTTTVGLTSSGYSNQADSAPQPNSGSLPDELEDGTQNSYWVTGGGLWHLVADPSCVGSSSATHAFYYGRDTYCNSNTGGANGDYLISPEYTIGGDENRLTFDYMLGTSNKCVPDFLNTSESRDVSSVAVSYDSGTSWQSVDRCLDEAQVWAPRSVRIAPNGATKMMVRFDFNGSFTFNNYLGFAVDDIDVDTVEAAGDFLVPPGATLSVTDIGIGGEDPLYASIEPDWGEPVSLGQDTDGAGPGYTADGPVVWTNDTDDPVHARIALRDTWCDFDGVTYYSDGTSFWDFLAGVSFDHANVTGSGTDVDPWHVAINDGGGPCSEYHDSEPNPNGNFEADVELIPAAP